MRGNDGIRIRSKGRLKIVPFTAEMEEMISKIEGKERDLFFEKIIQERIKSVEEYQKRRDTLIDEFKAAETIDWSLFCEKVIEIRINILENYQKREMSLIKESGRILIENGRRQEEIRRWEEE